MSICTTEKTRVEHASPEVSGRELLPLLVSVILSVICCGALVSALGYYTPFMIVGSVFMSPGAGLLSTLLVSTSLARRILYPAIFGVGVGVGAGFQQPFMAAQTVLTSADIPMGTSIMVFFAQTSGGAVALSIAQSVFVNRLQATVQIPGIDVKALLDAGATSLESMVAPRYQQELQGAYSHDYHADVLSCGYAGDGVDCGRAGDAVEVCKKPRGEGFGGVVVHQMNYKILDLLQWLW